MPKLTPAELHGLSRDAFVAAFGGVFEHSSWIAEQAFAQGPFGGVAALHAAMLRVLHAASTDAKLALIRAHPDLAGRAALAGELTEASKTEQSRSGLADLTADELARFHTLNNAYRAKFGFPFVMAVKFSNKHDILAAFVERLENDQAAELERALAEIGKIARFRLDDIVRG